VGWGWGGGCFARTFVLNKSLAAASIMPRLIALALAAACACAGAAASSTPSDYGLLLRAEAMAERLVTCNFSPSSGTFDDGEALWQSGNTIEALSNLMLADPALVPQYSQVLEAAYQRTAPVVDTCFDDHQWWLLAWVRAYQATGNFLYLQRAGQIHDFIVQGGWASTPCGGGVLWCPPPTNPYKNAVTNTLFLTASMELHPYASLLNQSADHYLVWAQAEWDWLAGSGIIDPATNLLNDGLDSSTCLNNNQTTWTYSQGLLLDGLDLLAQATGGNASTFASAQAVARAAMTKLVTATGILAEPCTNCDGDQHIFKGVWARHMGRVVSARLDPSTAYLTQAAAFLQHNAFTMLINATCGTAGFDILWQGGSCATVDTPTNSAGMDLLTAAALSTALLPPSPPPAVLAWVPLGLGGCADAVNNSMPNCYNNDGITEAACAAAATADPKAVAYDYQAQCDGKTSFCRVRSLAASPTSCPPGWGFTGGTATTVTQTVPSALTICLVRGA
jgi:hypothetical protein